MGQRCVREHGRGVDQHWVAPVVRVEIQIAAAVANSLVALPSGKLVQHLVVASGRVDIRLEHGASGRCELLLSLLSHLDRLLKHLFAPLQGPVTFFIIVLLEV